MFILPDKTPACCDGSYIGEGMFTRPDKHPACDVTGDCWVYFGDASLPHLIVDARGDPWLYWGTGDAQQQRHNPRANRRPNRRRTIPCRALFTRTFPRGFGLACYLSVLALVGVSASSARGAGSRISLARQVRRQFHSQLQHKERNIRTSKIILVINKRQCCPEID